MFTGSSPPGVISFNCATCYHLNSTLCHRRLGDLTSLYAFSDDQINQWINDAITEYSINFPWQICRQICSIISIEYPSGEDPPEYITRRPYSHKDFCSKNLSNSASYYTFLLEGIHTGRQRHQPTLDIRKAGR